MKAPCELVVWHILPAIRAGLSSALVDGGLSQKEVALRLGITQAAVSQYVSKKRGGGTELGNDVNDTILDLASEMMTGEPDVSQKICEICSMARKSGVLCEFHRATEAVPEGCNVCMI